MIEIIQCFIDNGGKDLVIKRSDQKTWLTYTLLTREDFRRLEEIGFVFHKRIHKIKTGEKVVGTVVPFLYFFTKTVDKKTVPLYKEEEEIVMKARPKKPTLEGKY